MCRPWQGAIIPTAHSYFRKVLQDCEKTYMWKDVGEAIMGPAFRNPYAESNARCAELFSFLNEALSQPRPSSPATYVVNAESLKEMSDSGIEPQLSIKNIRGGKYEHFKVSDIEGLNQWIYDPTLLYETKVSVLKIVEAHQLKTESMSMYVTDSNNSNCLQDVSAMLAVVKCKQNCFLRC